MGQTEIKIYVVLIGIVILVFIVGIILFVFQYRKRKLMHEKEKAAIEKQHKLDLLNNQLRIQQQTMQFIGSEIHDSVTQKLTLASIYSQKLEFENKHPDILEGLGKISSIINDSLAELRDLSKTLTNNSISDMELNELLYLECEKVNDVGICKAVIESDFSGNLGFTSKSFLLRIIQEFIQNSLKHSACSLIKIHLAAANEGLQITISDNGKGFDIDNIHSNGIGLNNMKRRAALIGGTFNLQSEAERGTNLQLFIDKKHLLIE